MNVVARSGHDDIAVVYIIETEDKRLVECVESCQPPFSRRQKWVLIVSTMFGCPVGCRFCDAGGDYLGRLSRAEIEFQIDYLVRSRFPDGIVSVDKFKIQLARMGEPALNPAVLDVLQHLPSRYQAPGLLVSLSTIAPRGVESFFERLLAIKRDLYHGRFQLQFSLHSSDAERRKWLVPVDTLSFAQIAAYGERFYQAGDRKVTLNFALAEGMPVEPQALKDYFDPAVFIIKMTPVNPTFRARQHGLVSHIDPAIDSYAVVDRLRAAGYEVLLSIGDVRENAIGSNCGQFLQTFLKEHASAALENGYSYRIEPVLPQ